MNKDKLRKLSNFRVRLRPIAKRFDGNTQLDICDDDWIITKVEDSGPVISNIRTGHTAILGFDHIHHYASDPVRDFDGLKHGFLILTVQVNIGGPHFWIEPLPLGRWE